MAKQLKLEVLLSAIDKITGPVKAATKSSDAMAKAVKANRDQLKTLQNAQKDINSFRTLNKASKASKDALGQQQEKIKDLAAQMRQSDTPTKGMIRSFNAATKAAKKLKDKHEQNTQKLSGLRTKLKDAGISTRDLGKAERNLKTDIDKTSKSLKKQQDQLKETGFQQRKLAAAKRKYESSQRLAGNMATGGAAGLGVAYGVKNIAEKTIAPGIDFGTQMSELQAVSRLDKEDPRFKMLKDQAKQFGASTAFTSSEVGAGQTFLSRAGFTPEAINASMKDVLELALANGTDLATTADIASNIGGAFKIDPEVEGNMQHIADILSGVSSRANVDLSMLGDTMKYLGQASGLDVSMEEAAAMAGLLGNIGIQGSMAGTTMRAMLNQLTAPAAKGAAAMKELGLQVKDSQGNMRGMPSIIADISAATESMGNVDRAAILKDIFGAEAGSGVAELIAQQGTGGLQTLISELKGVQGENAKMAATRADNIGGDLKSLESSLQSISLAITETNEGPLREFIQTMTGASRSVSEWATKNPELVATIAKIAVVVGIVAGVGGALLLVISSILGPLAALKYGFTVFSSVAGGLIPIVKGIGLAMSVVGKAMLANPIFLAIALIAGAAYLIYKNWEPIKEFFMNTWETIKTAFDGGFVGISSLILNWSPLGLFYKVFAGLLSYFGIDLPAKFTDFGSMMFDGLKAGIGSAGTGIWESVKTAFDGGILGISELILNWSPLGLFYKAFAGVLNYFGMDLPAKFTDFGSMMFDGLKAGIGSAGTGIWESVKTAFDGGILGISELIINWSPLGLFYKVFAGVLSYFGIDLPAKFTDFGSMMFDGLKAGIGSAGTGIWETIKTAFDGGILGISELILNWSPLGLFYKAFAGVLNYFGMDLPAKFTDFGSMMLDGLMGGITTKLSALKESVMGVGSSVAGWFKEKLGIHSPSKVFAEFGVNTLQGFENGIDKEEGTALNKMGKFAKNTAALGAGIVATSGAMAFDTQPAINPTAYSLAMPGMSNSGGGGDTYNFYVTGSDSKDIAAEIEAILRQRDAEKERQQRSTLNDTYSF